MTNMVEKAAKAINDEMLQHGDYKPNELARAAIAAMREPTDAMYMAGGSVSPSAHLADKDYKPYGTRRIGDMAAKAAWEKMIDAALEEKK